VVGGGELRLKAVSLNTQKEIAG